VPCDVGIDRPGAKLRTLLGQFNWLLHWASRLAKTGSNFTNGTGPESQLHLNSVLPLAEHGCSQQHVSRQPFTPCAHNMLS